MIEDKSKILIVCSSLSGMLAAVELASQGFAVECLLDRSLSHIQFSAQDDGLNAAIDLKSSGDDVTAHVYDTLAYSQGLAREQTIKNICRTAPRIINILERAGVQFARTTEGYLDAQKWDGSRFPRTFVGASSLSHSVAQALVEQVLYQQKLGRLVLHQGWEGLSVVLDEHSVCRGVVAQNLSALEVKAFEADAVIVAVNDMRGLYGPHAIAAHLFSAAFVSRLFDQGVPLFDCEFVSFTNHNAQKSFVDLALGGLCVNDAFMTPIDGLFAIGGCAAKCQGASVLPGNALLFELASALIAAKHLPEYFGSHLQIQNVGLSKAFEHAVQIEKRRIVDYLEMTGPESSFVLAEELSNIMMDCVGPLKENRKILEGRMRIDELKNRFQRITVIDKGTWCNQSLVHARTLEGLIHLADVVAMAALQRNESRGVHQKTELRERDDEHFGKHSKAVRHKDVVQISYE